MQKGQEIDKTKFYQIPDSCINYDTKFVFITSSYNQSRFVKKCLDSISSQKYPNDKYRIIYVDDASTDDTSKICEKWMYDNRDINMLLHIRDKNEGPASSRYFASKMTDDDEVLVFLDGDDWLIYTHYLAKISWLYKNLGVASTYGGNDREWCVEGQIYIRDKNWKARHGNYFPHIRTSRAKYCKRVPEEYLKCDGEWLKFCTDCALFQSIEELNDNNHIFIKGNYFKYNLYNTLNNKDTGFDAATDIQNSIRDKYAEHIKKLKPLKKII